MKFYCLLFIAFFLTILSHAQEKKKFVVSAHVGWSGNQLNNQPNFLDQQTENDRAISVHPRLAYNINQTWAVGVSYGYGLNKFDQLINVAIPDLYAMFFGEIKSVNHRTGVFVQSYLYNSRKFSAFLEMDAVKGWSNLSFTNRDNRASISQKYDLYSLGLHAGARYNFYRQLGLEFRMNNLASYNDTERILGDAEIGASGKNIGLFNSLLGDASVGLSFNF